MLRRLFVGISPPHDMCERLVRLITTYRREYPDVRWEDRARLHLTLRFLGTTQVSPDIILAQLKQKFLGFSQFFVTFTSVGTIVGRTAVVVLDAEKTESLLRVYHMVNNCLVDIGFPRDSRVFHPHVTLGRSKIHFSVARFTDIERFLTKVPFQVDAITLFQSIISAKGSHYDNLGQIRLDSGGQAG